MTQRVFDVDNPQDVKDLFDILPNAVKKIYKDTPTNGIEFYDKDGGYIDSCAHIRVNWHGKTLITRPADKTQFIGKLCWFQEEKNTMPFIGVLESINGDEYKCVAHLTPFKICSPVRRDEVQFAEDDESKEQ